MLGWNYNQGLEILGNKGQVCITLDNVVSPTHCNHQLEDERARCHAKLLRGDRLREEASRDSRAPIQSRHSVDC